MRRREEERFGFTETRTHGTDDRAIQETRQNMIMKTLLRRRMSNTPESSEFAPDVVRAHHLEVLMSRNLRDTLKTWEQVVRRILRSTITNNRSLYGENIGSHEDGDFHEAFRAFDRDGNGRISLSELADAFRRLDLGLSEKQISIILKHSDTDDDGDTYDEFVNLVDPSRKMLVAESTTSKSKTLEELAEGSPIVVKRKWEKEFGNPSDEDLKSYVCRVQVSHFLLDNLKHQHRYDFGPSVTQVTQDENNIVRDDMSLEKNMDNEDDDEEEELLVPDEDDLKYVKNPRRTTLRLPLPLVPILTESRNKRTLRII